MLVEVLPPDNRNDSLGRRTLLFFSLPLERLFFAGEMLLPDKWSLPTVNNSDVSLGLCVDTLVWCVEFCRGLSPVSLDLSRDLFVL